MRLNLKQYEVIRAMAKLQVRGLPITLDAVVEAVQERIDPEFRIAYFRSNINQSIKIIVPKLAEHGITLKPKGLVGRGYKAEYSVEGDLWALFEKVKAERKCLHSV